MARSVLRTNHLSHDHCQFFLYQILDGSPLASVPLEGFLPVGSLLHTSMPVSAHFYPARCKFQEISADLRRSPQISADLRRSPQTSADLRRSPQISADLRRSPQISANLCRSLQISADLCRYHIVETDVFTVWRSADFANCEAGSSSRCKGDFSRN